MEAYLRQRLGHHVEAVEFVGGVPPEQVPGLIAGSQLCVFPSRWEAFGYACLEAMAAGRAIVGTSDTGLAEVLGHGSAGRLVPPRAPRPLADAIVELLQSPAECLRLGEAARRRVLGEYDAAAVCPLHEAALREAIAHRRSLGPRHLMPTLGIAA
jgi:glycosyltransferase involved in cell wall biosynthesis